jgi:S1-C subfamily serine protease
MKANRLVWLFQFLMLGVAVAQQTNSASGVINSETSFAALKAQAENGDGSAQESLGFMYENGQGISQDYVEAAKWYRREAEQGYIWGEVSIGLCYYTGDGVPKNYVEAYKWLNLASAHTGNNDTERKLVEYSAKLREGMVNLGEITPDQVAEAQQLSAAFVPKKEKPNSNSNSPITADSPAASGTGFFITADGYLITNYHVVKDASRIFLVTSNIFGSGEKITTKFFPATFADLIPGVFIARVVKVDAANDLALLKAVGKFSPLPITASRSAHLGGTVATIGFPDPSLQGFSPKLAKGEIASLSGAADDPRYFQISVPVQPGNSGGALVDERGNVIGIVSAKLDASVALAASGALPENVNYAIKSSLLLSFLESVPDVASKLKAPNTADEKFEDVVKSAQNAAVLVLVY